LYTIQIGTDGSNHEQQQVSAHSLLPSDYIIASRHEQVKKERNQASRRKHLIQATCKQKKRLWACLVERNKSVASMFSVPLMEQSTTPIQVESVSYKLLKKHDIIYQRY
jgi:RAB protein geranylgeranyltransferase component A